MAREGRGSIVNVSSIYGLLSPVQDLYDFRRERARRSSSRWPIRSRSRRSSTSRATSATYWAKAGVRVNTLTLAGVWNDQPREFLDAYTARAPMGGCRRRRRRSAPSSSSRRTPRRTSRAPTSSSTAAGPPGDPGGNGSRISSAARPFHPAPTAGWTSCAPPTAACSAVSPARSTEDVAAAVAAARSAQPAWAERTAVERGDLLRDLALLLRERREEASEIVVEETGKPIGSRWARRMPPRWASSSRARAGGPTGGRRPRACLTGPCSRSGSRSAWRA